MTNKQFIIELSKRINTSQIKTKVFLEELVSLARELVLKGHVVQIKNFGSFKLMHQKQRLYYNPHVRSRVLCMPKKKVVFKMSKQLL